MAKTTTSQSRFAAAIAAFDDANRADPNLVDLAGEPAPKELLYARRMTGWLIRLAPDASEALRLAVRAQHIRRWESPRGDYPKDRAGYLEWRSGLARFHARVAGEILESVGYDAETTARVQALMRKQRLKRDPEVQTLEDVACLVFLENYFADFSTRHDREKIIGILRKTWAKMSPAGHDAALGLDLDEAARALLDEALAG
jgi:hypothetical protein